METLEIKIQVQSDSDQLHQVIEKVLQIRREFLPGCKHFQVATQLKCDNQPDNSDLIFSGSPSAFAGRF